MNSDGLAVIISPVQMAAMLCEQSLTAGEVLSNRLWGGLEFALGIIEMVGAAALCGMPEPSGLSKWGCIVVGAHSMDTIKTAADKVISGLNTRSATHRVTEALARKFAVNEKAAFKIGLVVDIAVPVGFAITYGALRISSVRSGRLSLARHEAAGGHTIARHVAKSADELLQRLADSPNMQSASTFTDLSTAEKAISIILKNKRRHIKQWAGSPVSAKVLELTHDVGDVVGFGFRQGSTVRHTTSRVRVVLLKKTYNGQPYYILTAYPWVNK